MCQHLHEGNTTTLNRTKEHSRNHEVQRQWPTIFCHARNSVQHRFGSTRDSLMRVHSEPISRSTFEEWHHRSVDPNMATKSGTSFHLPTTDSISCADNQSVHCCPGAAISLSDLYGRDTLGLFCDLGIADAESIFSQSLHEDANKVSSAVARRLIRASGPNVFQTSVYVCQRIQLSSLIGKCLRIEKSFESDHRRISRLL